MNVRALVIEDSPVLRNILMQSLRQSGLADFEFTVACDGQDGLTKYQPGKFDILFVDWNMPRMNGIDFVREVRAHETSAPIPICMVTTEKGMGKIEEALQSAGATAYITKPFTIEDLRRALTPLISGIGAAAGSTPEADPSSTAVALGHGDHPDPSHSPPEPRAVPPSHPSHEPTADAAAAAPEPAAVIDESARERLAAVASETNSVGQAASLPSVSQTDPTGRLAACPTECADTISPPAAPPREQPAPQTTERSPSRPPVRVGDATRENGSGKRAEPAGAIGVLAVLPLPANGASLRRAEPGSSEVGPVSDAPSVAAPRSSAVPPVIRSAPDPAAAPAADPPAARRWERTAGPVAVDRASMPAPAADEHVDQASFLADFLTESHANLDRLQADLLALLRDAPSDEAISSIFRTVHTLKAGCGCLQLPKLEALSHAAEELLTRLRDGGVDLDGAALSALGDLASAGRECLTALGTRRDEGRGDYGPLIVRLLTLARREPIGSTTPTAPRQRFGDLLVSQGRLRSEELEEALLQQMRGDPRHLGEILVERNLLNPWEVRETLQLQEAVRSGTLASDTVRVERRLLDRFSELVADLDRVVTLVLPPGRRPSEALADLGACRLQRITADLRHALLEASTQSLGELWRRLPRLVDEVSSTCGKQVRLETAGETIRIDRHLAEPLREALVHALRNAVDHGIETPEWRIACGKLPEGHLTLCANLEGDHVNVEIGDDGAGIDLNHIKRRALQLGLITAPYAAGMSSQELVELVFTPGFSTTEEVTKLSGRGVGLDVVKHSVEKMGGTVDLVSRHGQGTTMRIRFPRSARSQSLGDSRGALDVGS